MDMPSDAPATGNGEHDLVAVNADVPLTIEGRDYLTAASGSASRTRSVTLTLVALSVVMFIGMLNSIEHSWAGARIMASQDSESAYVISHIGLPPIAAVSKRDSDEYKRARAAYEERYQQLYSSLMRSYVETGFAVRVPFFGVAIDVNDIGFIGGFAFVIVLIMFDLSLRRERENLDVAFAYASVTGQLRALYDLLAMHQLFTAPRRRADARRGLTALLPKVICLLPLIVQAAVVGHDIATNAVGESLDPPHNSVLLRWEIIWSLVMIPLTGWVVFHMVQIDRIWDSWASKRFKMLS